MVRTFRESNFKKTSKDSLKVGSFCDVRMYYSSKLNGIKVDLTILSLSEQG